MVPLPPNPSAASLGRPGLASRRAESGSALVLVIFILTILVGLTVSVSYTVRVDLAASRNFADRVQTRALADGAVHAAMAVLKNDTDTGQDTEEDDWALLGDLGATEYALGDGYYRVQILDANSRLDLNTATRDQLLRLPNMTEELADSIIDWRDTDQEVSGQGAELDYYQSLSPPYLPKDGPFDTVDELLLVKGFTPRILYGQPAEVLTTNSDLAQLPLAEYLTTSSGEANLTATGEQRLNLSQVTAQQLMELEGPGLSQQQAQAIVNRRNSSAYTSVADLLDVQGLQPDQVASLVDLVTVKTESIVKGRINVNTAPDVILMMLPGVTEEVAASIISHRPYATVGELLRSGAVETPVFRQIAESVCTKSSVFIVRAIGQMRAMGLQTAVAAVVQRTTNDVQILQRREVQRWPGWANWGWNPPDGTVMEALPTTTTTGLGSSSQ